MDTSHKLVFICGLHRSGTSILHEALRAHPEISGFINTGVAEDEGQHLQSIILQARAFGGPGKFGFDPRAAMTESHALMTQENSDQLFQQWSAYWDTSRPILIEKSPPNLIRTRFLQAMFPNSYFIVLTRHPLAVSLATQKWAKSCLTDLLRHWLTAHQIFEQDKPFLNRLCMISYEQLVYHPAETLERIGQFLGIEIPLTLSCADHNKAYFEKWKEPGMVRQINRLRVTFKYERVCNHFGYSLRHTTRIPVFEGFSQHTKRTIRTSVISHAREPQ